ncbi:MAG: hypothetical protein LH613_17365, partial [Chamaesiphon sp.]|nr:hypothetical protein [Chamaesiphon sp.]
SAKRMLEAAAKIQLSDPWKNFPAAHKQWQDWWRDKEKAKGQTPSLMFLWYLICLERNTLNSIVSPLGGTHHLKMVFRGTTEEILDIYCAQLKYQETESGATELLSSSEVIMNERFPVFSHWMHRILSKSLSGINVGNYKQLSLLIAAATELDYQPENLSAAQWNVIGQFIRSPRIASKQILGNYDAYPEPKGRWNGERGQKKQCDKAVQIFAKILEISA